VPARGHRTLSSLEHAQRQFAAVPDGDYLLTDLMDRSPAVAVASWRLFGAFYGTRRCTRMVRFRGTCGPMYLQRQFRAGGAGDTFSTDCIRVIVRNGRVVRFTAG
jgi:hypothetical protein